MKTKPQLSDVVKNIEQLFQQNNIHLISIETLKCITLSEKYLIANETIKNGDYYSLQLTVFIKVN